MEKPDIEKIFVCGCHGEGLQIYKFDDMELIFVALWKYGLFAPTIWQRLGYAWRMIRWGIVNEEVNFNPETARAVAAELNALASTSASKSDTGADQSANDTNTTVR